MKTEIANVTDPAIAINVNKTYQLVKNADDLYDYTRGIWRVNLDHVRNARYAFSVVQGVIKEVYEIDSWHSAGSTKYKTDRDFLGTDMKPRSEFIGNIAPDEIRNKYLGKTLEGRSWGQPIRYYNC